MSCLCSTMSGASAGKTWTSGGTQCCCTHIWCLGRNEPKADRSWDADQVPPCGRAFCLGLLTRCWLVLENEPFKRIRWKRHSLGSCMWIVPPSSVAWSSHGFSQVQEKRAKILFSMGQESTNLSYVF